MTVFHAIYVLLMVALIVAVDLVFFRSRALFWQRLVANVGIVVVAVILYLAFAGRR